MSKAGCVLALTLTALMVAACQQRTLNAGLLSDAGALDAGGVCNMVGCDCTTSRCGTGLVCEIGHTCQEPPTCASLAGQCVADSDCCQGSDPLKGRWCNEEGECAACAKPDTPCRSDYDCCPTYTPPYYHCDTERTCSLICDKDSDCAIGKVCLSTNECVPIPCSTDEECAGTLCCAGKCKADCGYGDPAACVITTPNEVVSKTRKVALHAVSTNASGDIVPRQTFTWKSSDETKVKVDADGIVKGQDVAGAATITARLGPLDCGSVRIRNLPLLADGETRVVVLDRTNGNPVVGAYVYIGSRAPVGTNSEGIVAKETPPGDIHVFHDDYSYLSILGVSEPDYLVYLTPVVEKAGGFKGKFDYSMFHFILNLGFAGCSLADVFALGPSSIFGEPLLTHLKMQIDEGDIADFDDWVWSPAGFHFGRKVFSENKSYKDYLVTCTDGFRSAWGIGNDYNPIVLTEISSPDYSLNAAEFISFFLEGRHALQPFFQVDPIPLIETPNDGTPARNPISDKPYISDYANFPVKDMDLKMQYRLRTIVSLPLQPKAKGKFLKSVLGVEGTLMPDMGLVPLALAADADTSDPPDGVTDAEVTGEQGVLKGQLLFHAAPPYRGLEQQKFLTAIMALDLDSPNSLGFGFFDNSTPISVILKHSDKIESSHDLTGTPFMPFAEGAIFYLHANEIVPVNVEGADLYRYQFDFVSGRPWAVYVVSDMNEPFSLPTVPFGLEHPPLYTDLTIHAVKLRDDISASSLFALSTAPRPDDWMFAIDKFSSVACLEKLPPTDEKCLAKHPDPACDPVCELREFSPISRRVKSVCGDTPMPQSNLTVKAGTVKSGDIEGQVETWSQAIVLDQTGSRGRMLVLWKDSSTLTTDGVVMVTIVNGETMVVGTAIPLDDENVAKAEWEPLYNPIFCDPLPCEWSYPTSVMPEGKGGELVLTSPWPAERCATVSGTVTAGIRDNDMMVGLDIQGGFTALRMSVDDLSHVLPAP